MTDHMGLVPMSAEITMFYTDYTASLALAAQQERERIIKAWDLEMDCDCDNAFLHMRSRIEGEQK
jgi:hypothetical protein